MTLKVGKRCNSRSLNGNGKIFLGHLVGMKKYVNIIMRLN
jgi:hypothetical protein